jgi:hypothetical protein
LLVRDLSVGAEARIGVLRVLLAAGLDGLGIGLLLSFSPERSSFAWAGWLYAFGGTNVVSWPARKSPSLRDVRSSSRG